MKKIILLIIVSFFISCASSKNYKLIKKEYDHLDRAEGEITGFGGSGSRLYYSFHKAFDSLSIRKKESLALKGGVVPKLYASFFFINNKDKIIKIFKNNLKDHRPVEYQMGCLLDKYQVNIGVLMELDKLISRASKKDFSEYVLGLIAHETKRLNYYKSNVGSSEQKDFLCYQQEKKIAVRKKWSKLNLKELKYIRDTLTNIALNSSESSIELRSRIDYLKKQSLKK